MNEAIMPIEADPENQSLTLRAVRNCTLGDEVVIARDGTKALDYPLGVGRRRRVLLRLVLPSVELPKVNGLAGIRRMRYDEGTKPLLVTAFPSEDPPPPLNERGLAGGTRRPVTPEEVEGPVPRLGLRWLITGKASLEGRGSES